jgi:uncharacterized protein
MTMTSSDHTRIPDTVATTADDMGVTILVADPQDTDEGTDPPQPARYEVRPGSLKARLRDEQRAALKAGEKVRLSALRMLSAAVTNREVELARALTDQEFEEVALREVKRRKEAVEAFASAGRDDRAQTEREEQRILEAYVPAGLSEEEVDALVDEAVSATGASGMGDLGKVMGFVMAKAKGRVDGKVVQAKVRARLG